MRGMETSRLGAELRALPDADLDTDTDTDG
jgi:hypothetical protein